jgi:hypothetical protein
VVIAAASFTSHQGTVTLAQAKYIEIRQTTVNEIKIKNYLLVYAK